MESVISPEGNVTIEKPELDLPPECLPDLDQLITEDGKPVENLFIERLYALLKDPLYGSWSWGLDGKPFVAMSNVGWFFAGKQPPLVPDFLLSLGITPLDPRTREGRSYFQWLLGKPPDLVLEIVSDRRGGEDSYELDEYARLGVPFYVIYDPDDHLNQGVLRAFEGRGRRYVRVGSHDGVWFEDLALGLTFWEGTYHGYHQTWLRWCDEQRQILPTGAERALLAAQQRDLAAQQLDLAQRARLESEANVDRLREQLRKLGIEPDA